MKITRELIESGLSEKGGLNDAQLRILRTAPFRHFRAIGREIGEAEAKRFVELRGQSRSQRTAAENDRTSGNLELPERWVRVRFDSGCMSNSGPNATWGYVITNDFGERIASDAASGSRASDRCRVGRVGRSADSNRLRQGG